MNAPYYADESVSLFHGDCLDVLREMAPASVDAVVTDPPYGLEFMGKDWDAPWKDVHGNPLRSTQDARDTAMGRERGGADPYIGSGIRFAAGLPFQQWCEQWTAECLRVLKPGGHMLAFGGSRTWHRLACAVEDAGFEVRDSIAWLYGSGFPKSLDVSKAIDKAAGAERVVIGPNDRHHGGGTNNVYAQDEWTKANFAAKTMLTAPATPAAQTWQGWGTALKPAFEPIVVARKPLIGTVAANVLAHGTGALNIDGCRVDMGAEYDPSRVQRQSVDTAGMNGLGESGFSATHEQGTYNERGRWPANVVLDESQAAALDEQSGTLTSGSRRAGDYELMGYMGADVAAMPAITGDTGGASRFFPTFHYEAKAPTDERPRVDGVAHPTVKPLDLMRWLVRLVTPPGGTVLEPFAGSGTTAEACVIEGFKCIAIEREAAYLPLITARLSKPIQVGLDFGGAA